MGLIGKYIAYRHLSGGGSGGGGSGEIAVLLLFVVGPLLLFYGLYTLFAPVFIAAKQAITPYVMFYPPVTLPATTVLIGSLAALLPSYSPGKVERMLGVSEGSSPSYYPVVFGTILYFGISGVGVGLVLVHPIEQWALWETLILGVVLGIFAMLLPAVAIYLPYSSIRLLLHLRWGPAYAIATVTPLLGYILWASFAAGGVNGAILDGSVASVGLLTGLMLVVFLPGPVMVTWQQTKIYQRAMSQQREGVS